MNDPKWTLTTNKTIYETQSKGLRVQKRLYTCEDGRTKQVELKDEGDYGHTFALTPDNKVILIRQFRVGPDKYFYESPAGQLNKEGNSEEQTLRELHEETGYTTNDYELLQIIDDSAYTTAKRYFYLARNCIKTSEQELDEDEYIDTIKLATIDEVIQMIHTGEYLAPLLAYMAFEKLGILHWKKEPYV
jgi:ADP-ribose pyrophosphatase